MPRCRFRGSTPAVVRGMVTPVMAQADLFSAGKPAEAVSAGGAAVHSVAPLAARMRPRNLAEYAGQTHILAPGQLLRRAIEADRIQSLIFYGPLGTGKTSLAQIIAELYRRRWDVEKVFDGSRTSWASRRPGARA